MFRKLIKSFDWLIYRLSFHSMRRMFQDDPGMAYLLKLELDRLAKDSNMPDTLKQSAETFYSTLIQYKAHEI